MAPAFCMGIWEGGSGLEERECAWNGHAEVGVCWFCFSTQDREEWGMEERSWKKKEGIKKMPEKKISIDLMKI